MLIFAVLPSLFNAMRKVTTTIRQALFAYAASVKVLHPAAQLETRVQVFCRTSLHRRTKEQDWQREPEVAGGSHRSRVSLATRN